MKRLTTVCVATVFSCGVAITAQTQGTGRTQQTQTQRPATTNSDQTRQRQTTTPSQTQGRAATSMFIGCVEKGSTPNAFVLSVTEIPGSATAAGQVGATAGISGQRTGTQAEDQARGQAQGQAQGQSRGETEQGRTQARAGQGNTDTGAAHGNTQAQGRVQATGTTGTATVGHRLELIGGTSLAGHVGHKVEITGMVVPQGTATGRAGQTAAADMRVNVSNVRMIDANCVAATGTRGTTGTSGTTTSEPMPAPGRQNTEPDRQGTPDRRQY